MCNVLPVALLGQANVGYFTLRALIIALILFRSALSLYCKCFAFFEKFRLSTGSKSSSLWFINHCRVDFGGIRLRPLSLSDTIGLRWQTP